MADKLKITGVSVPSELSAGDTYKIYVSVQNIDTGPGWTVSAKALVNSVGLVQLNPTQVFLTSGMGQLFYSDTLTMPNATEIIYCQPYYWDGTQWVDGQRFAAGPYKIALVGGTASLYGEIHSDKGLVANAKATLTGPQSYTSYSDTSGRFQFLDVPIGTYTLTLTKAGYRTWSESVVLDLAGIGYDIFPYMTSEVAATIQGFIHDSGGSPIPAVSIAINGRTTATQIDGTFTASDIEPGPYTIVCTKTSWQNASKEVTLVAGDNQVDITMLAVGETPPSKSWWDKHWKEVAIGGGCAAAIGGGIALAVRKRKR